MLSLQNTITPRTTVQEPTLETLRALEVIQQRVLWLSTLMIHHANHVRPNPDKSKVGGHQASSASVVSVLTALYFHFLTAGDRVSIKPHASPAFHAVQYLLGQLPREYLTELRAFHGLQSYPSRTKDPDRVDFSTGSVGLGAAAPAFGALAQVYAARHLGPVTSNRFVAVMGDAELDEGNIWESILEEALEGLGNLLWIVDLNRQSLDRVVPGIRAARLKRVFAENGWQVLEAKYGSKLQALFAQPDGGLLRERIDEMSNEEYQAMVRMPGNLVRAHLTRAENGKGAAIARVIQDVPDDELPGIAADLGGHDLGELIRLLSPVDAEPNRPTVLFAYTIKGWQLPIAAHPLNHSALLSETQMQELAQQLEIAPGTEWDRLDASTPAGQLCEQAAARLYPVSQPVPKLLAPTEIPDDLAMSHRGATSTQDAFGQALIRLVDLPAVRPHIVTASPDVAVSTNLAGWINKVGVYAGDDRHDYETEAQRLLKWKPGPQGQHIELGISEMNLFLLLGMFGLTAELSGQLLIPIGTLYDPFILRGLDALVYALYSGGKFIFAGTPSGISLSPEGGAHQSTVTPSLGIELPQLDAYEPCFSRELEWVMVEALRQCCDRVNGRSTYLRLSTKLIEQDLMQPALDVAGHNELRRHVLAGGYRLRDWKQGGAHISPDTVVHIAASGVMVPEAIKACELLWQEGIAANVLNLVSPRALYRRWREQRHQPRDAAANPFPWLVRDDEVNAPFVTVQDGASHALAWLGSAYGVPVVPLGVDDFGQSGTRAELYEHFEIDADSIADAAFAVLGF